MESVPFHFPSLHGGISSAAGVLRLTDDGLHCEYRINVAGLGWKTDTRETTVLWEEMESVTFRPGWFRHRAELLPTSLKVLDRFPASSDHAVLFHFKRKDRSRAAWLISELDLRRSQRNLVLSATPAPPIP